MVLSARMTAAGLMLALLTGPGAQAAPFRLSSPAFQDGQSLPLRFTQTGMGPSGILPPGQLSASVSPPLQWSDPPPGTRAFVLLLTDHADLMIWAVVNIPGEARALPEAIPNGNHSAKLPAGAFHKSLRSNGWLGPGGGTTPAGQRTYYWKLYPLDAHLSLAEDASWSAILKAM